MKKLALICAILLTFITLAAKTYVGNIGPYSIRMTITTFNCGYDRYGEYVCKVKGQYTYTKGKNTLRLSGIASGSMGYRLEEFTPRGKNSGTFQLNENANGTLSGYFINNSNGNEYRVILRPVR